MCEGEMTRTKPYIVQIQKPDKRNKSGYRWIFYSDHNWDDMAIISAKSISECRKLKTRVIYTPNRKVILEVENALSSL
jgi:hypothetical protein